MIRKSFENDWDEILSEEFEKGYFKDLQQFVVNEYENKIIYPARDEIWTAFQHTPFREVKVVLLGQDPYHGPGQAHGLSFSVKPGVPQPPSLRNMMKELQSDIGCAIPRDGNLVGWAKQGVLLLNNVLTVREGEAHSHRGRGWERFTDVVIRKLAERNDPIVFILWGNAAREKKRLLEGTVHQIVESVHPSPLSAHRGFFGSRPYSKTNEILQATGQESIHWDQISDVL